MTVAAILGLTLIGFWVLFLVTIQGDSEHPIMYLPLPLGLMAMLMFGGHLLRRHAIFQPQLEGRQPSIHG